MRDWRQSVVTGVPGDSDGSKVLRWICSSHKGGALAKWRLVDCTAYDAERRVLYLRFQSGDVYRYFEFSHEQYQDFLNAESHGKYFLSYIRDLFKYERVAKLRVA